MLFFKKTIDNYTLNDYINKCADIYLYRNALIHNGGTPSNDLLNKAKFYKVDPRIDINFSKELINNFIDDYHAIFNFLENKVRKTYSFYNEKTRIEKLKELWYRCFDSPILAFEDYWDIDYKNDLIVNIKYPRFENSISSGEEILLSIWRHQYYDAIKTKEFLLCSINYREICELYEGLYDLKFYYMYQEAERLGHERIRLK